ncbi:MAG: tRNA (adenosine(37)-N6)-threonylcarbamoyltransferase complex dimerization subunit type 1 TsaB [Deltaproteobacteria bacterium]|nr:MAG: tRNA (adenosine(37)-N6)-threonylcarbamoyltransferase complex dimerization subunit type 1 TsaB [Deltaproteobacteria bacterium]
MAFFHLPLKEILRGKGDMKILAVDTATKSCSVAVVNKRSLLAEMTTVRKQTHSRHLMKMIEKVIGLSGLALSELDGFAVTRGPGTFTGMRIGISSVKGLATATGKPVVGVSSLDALAMQASFFPYLICPFIDASRGEVYFSRYKFRNGHLEKEADEQVSSPEKAVFDLNETCLFIGDGALLYQKTILNKMDKSAFFASSFQNTLRASTVAYISMDRLKNDDTDDIGIFVPHYIRKSDAELNLMVS